MIRKKHGYCFLLSGLLLSILLAGCQTGLSVVGQRWSLSTDVPGEKVYRYDIVFHPGGRLENHHPNDRTPDNDTWEQRGSTVILKFNNSYITYTGQFENPRTLKGEALNIRGLQFPWKAERID